MLSFLGLCGEGWNNLPQHSNITHGVGQRPQSVHIGLIVALWCTVLCFETALMAAGDEKRVRESTRSRRRHRSTTRVGRQEKAQQRRRGADSSGDAGVHAVLLPGMEAVGGTHRHIEG